MKLNLVAQSILAVGLISIMFGIGLSLLRQDFISLARSPRALLVGLSAQIIGLPAAGILVILIADLPPEYALGLLIIASSPGGATSNLFSYLMKADVALSVSLTAAATVICTLTVPLTLANASGILLQQATTVSIPAGKILAPLMVLVLLPLIVGMVVREKCPNWAQRMYRPTARLSVLLLILTIGYVLYLEQSRLQDYLVELGGVISLLFLLAIAIALLASHLAGLRVRQTKTILIEVGIQNGVQAMFVATSPLIFNNTAMAIPAALYSILMYLYMFLIYLLFRVWRTERRMS
ncbi:MAG: bile acid:sodium symporter [Gammaproteobacteria bacterium]|nr:bile acid:sodium symporter [Gammaproteobacteria bacterium]